MKHDLKAVYYDSLVKVVAATQSILYSRPPLLFPPPSLTPFLPSIPHVIYLHQLYKVAAEEEEVVGPLEDCVVTRMAIKDVS